ncbi:dehydration-responsive element-binding protein 1H [Oryza glaberrima]|nr:dehydration-responsive element-binding protein 1H [Oryza glaberrima]
MHTYIYTPRAAELEHSHSASATRSHSLGQAPPSLDRSRAAMDMAGHEVNSSSSSSGAESSSSSSGRQQYKKRPAGRTKFRETRHPVYRGVRRRGGAGRWVCEVRVPGKRGARLWLGTYVTAEAAARAHDAAMIALRGGAGGGGAACLNFQDSAWLLAVPPAAPSDLAGVRRAATEAVAGFLQRNKTTNGASVAEAMDEATSGVSAPPPLANNAGSSETPGPSSIDGTADTAAGAALDMFELDFFGEMDYDTYYASLAEGLLMEPPPPATALWDNGDEGADIALWSY